jgi:hypothetical protein
VRTRIKSARRHDDSPQLHLLEPRPNPKRLAYTLDQVRACPNEVSAIDLSCRVSGLLDKQIADALSMDEGNWSKLRRGQRGFMPGDRIHFMNVVGNQILREWEEESLGYDCATLRIHQSALEQQVEVKDARIAELEHRLEIITEFIKTTRVS